MRRSFRPTRAASGRRLNRLIAFSGLPGVGKTTLARALASEFGFVYLRIDSIEDAITSSALAPQTAEDAGYLAAAAVARDNLAAGLTVVADMVDPVAASRKIWHDTADELYIRLLRVEVICSDQEVHRQRIEARASKPDWQGVLNREYEPLTDPDFQIDTAQLPMDVCLARLMGYVLETE